MNNPLISILTVNLNNAAGLEKTIGSVLRQPYKPIEFIVIDGDSIDESKSILTKYAQQIQVTISEKDTGIYNAMNKGIAKSNGEYLLFLNSGDILLDKNPLQQLISTGNNSDLIFGNIQVSDVDKKRNGIFPDILSFKFFYINSLPHPCTLIKRSLFNLVGLYREDFKIVSDWAFFVLAVCKYNCSYKHVNVLVADFDSGGISSTQLHLIEEERAMVLKEHFAPFINDYRELYSLDNEVNKARKLLGYRIHHKLMKIFSGNGN